MTHSYSENFLYFKHSRNKQESKYSKVAFPNYLQKSKNLNVHDSFNIFDRTQLFDKSIC